MKRYLGRIPLRLLFNLTSALVLVLATAAIVTLVHHRAQAAALDEAGSKAELILDRNLAIHTYFSHVSKPAVFGMSDEYRPDDYFDPTWMSSTYAVREIDRTFHELSAGGPYYKEAAINARSPENEADAYEAAFIDELNADPELIYREAVREIDGERYFVSLRRAEMTEEGCLLCHGDPAEAPAGLVAAYGPERGFGRQVGEYPSAISIRVPLEAAYAGADRLTWQLSAIMVSVMAGVVALRIWFGERLIFGPLGRVRDRATAIAAGDRPAAAQLERPLGRELAQLTDAFTSMAETIQAQQDELEERVRERTAELESAQERVVAQERLAAVGHLAAGIAHEFNNIMAAVMLTAETTLLRGALDPTDRAKLRVIYQQAEHAADLTQKVLDFGRRAVLRQSAIDLVELVAEFGRQQQRALPPEIGLLVELPVRPLRVRADPERIQQALHNLAANARAALLPAGGRLAIALRADDETGLAVLTVRDEGVGIPPEVLPHVFEPFFTTREVGQGSGLGLSQALGIVKQHDGDIEIESKIGRGTTVRITLPLLPAEPAAAVEAARHPAGSTVLLVESNEPVRAALADALESLGHDVETASDAAGALELLRADPGRFGVALVDLALPQMGGRGLARAAQGVTPGLPVLLLTVRALDADPAELRSEHIVGWLQKPIDLDRLAAAVKAAL